ncbi:MAG: 16S rRNA (adenine(1518)-N(6)/adenine(1519)-N(6))-dimethyltransferase RsmA [Verrucomicrobiota bacterium]
MTGVKQTLEKLGIVPDKQLGQNFLTDSNFAAWIVRQLGDGELGTVIEIGPGLGALTENLVGRAKRLVLVEFDKKLAAHLTERFKDDATVEVIHADAAQIDLRPFFANGPVSAIGNLPYSAAGAILQNFLNPPSPVRRGVFMLQAEMADRICASPRTKAYGILTLRIQAHYVVRRLRTIPTEPFHPRPTVDSTVIELDARDRREQAVFDHRLFDRMVRHGFSQRRKQLKKLLPESPLPWGKVVAELGVEPTCRGEELSLDQWISLTNLFDSHPLKDHAQKDDELFDVVDENNEVVAQKPRHEVHAEGLRHRAIHIFVYNKKGELFLQKRTHLKDACPGLWDSSAAGHLDAGEDYATAAFRELEEELGVQAEPKLLGEIEAHEDTGWEFVQLFAARHDGPFTWPASEIETGTFFPLDVIEKWIANRPEDFAPGFIRCWKLCEELRG